MTKKTYPAKARKATRKQPLPATLEVEVQRDGHLFHASARRKCATGHSGAWATRKLAELLGYSKHADVIYVCKDAASGAARFSIVEVL
jgi:hypothetical protein